MTHKNVPIGNRIQNLKLTQQALLPISQFCSNPPKFIRRVDDLGRVFILTRHGRPVAGLVPISGLTVIEMYEEGRLVEPYGIYAPNNFK